MSNRSDNFNRANGDLNGSTPSDGGSAVVVTSGSYLIESNQAAPTTNGTPNIALYETSNANMEVSANFYGSVATIAVGLQARVSVDGLSRILAFVSDQLYIYVTGVTGPAPTPMTWVSGDLFKLRCQADGHVLFYKNGALVIDWNPGSNLLPSNTRAGFRVDAASGASTNPVDNFISTDLGGGSATAALTGTITSATTEANVIAGGKTIILTLTGDTFVAAGATFDAQRQNIINGIDSAQAEAAGWDAVVKAGLAVTDVVRTSSTVVTVTLPAFAGFNITATETITATLPSTALTGAVAIVASPTFTVTSSTVTAALAGTITSSTTEVNIVSGGKTIILTLANDTWAASGATFDAQRQNIINGIDSAQAEITGWDAVVKAGLAVTAVVRTSATVVTVTLPAFASFDITATETITATIPSTALTGAGAVVASPTFTVSATGATAPYQVFGSSVARALSGE